MPPDADEARAVTGDESREIHERSGDLAAEDPLGDGGAERVGIRLEAALASSVSAFNWVDAAATSASASARVRAITSVRSASAARRISSICL